MSFGTRLSGSLRVSIDAVVHALVFVVLVAIFGGVTGTLRGGETIEMMHQMLFIFGVVLLGIGTTMFSFASPVSASKKNTSRIRRDKQRKRLDEARDERDDDKVKPTTTEGILPFHTVIWLIPPLRWVQPPETANRVRPPGKVMLAGVLALGIWAVVSFLQIV